jgi:hypothetical protein
MLLYVPAAHGTHTSPDGVEPGGHTHAEADVPPVLIVVIPAGHAVHALSSPPARYVPMPQPTHSSPL